MSDLSILYVRVCESNLRLSKKVKGSGGREYRVDFDHQRGWSCDCPAAQFHPRTPCKHVREAEAAKCDWNHDAFAGSGDLDFHGDKCPECGGPTEVVKIGV